MPVTLGTGQGRDGILSGAGQKLDLEQYIPYRIAVLSGQIGLTSTRLYRQHFGFGLREWRMIAVLGQTGEQTLSQLSRTAKVDTGTAARALKTLVEKGLVSKRDDELDQRKVQFALTDVGHKVLDRVANGALERERALLEPLSAADRKKFMQLLLVLEKRAAELEHFDPYASDPNTSE